MVTLSSFFWAAVICFQMVCVLMHALALVTCFVYMLQPTIFLLSIFTQCLQHLIFHSVCNSLSFVVITSIKGKRSLIFTDSTLMILFYSITLLYFNIFVYGIAVTVFLSVMLYCYSIFFL
jgi:hypothetical protein